MKPDGCTRVQAWQWCRAKVAGLSGVELAYGGLLQWPWCRKSLTQDSDPHFYR